MNFSDFVKAASKKLGRPIARHLARYAVTFGAITPPPRSPDGWYAYNDKHVDELVAYARNRSRKLRNVVAK